MPHAQRIAEFLLDIGAVKLSVDPPFTWTSGLKAPIYCDNRMVLSHPEARSFIVSALTDRVRHLHIEPDCIAGTATAGIPWGALVADRLALPFVYVRPKAKEHGAKKRLEGDLKAHQHVVVVEDLLSTGGSAISTVDAIREEGKCDVSDIVAIFSYEFLSSREKAQEAGVHLHPLTTIMTLLAVAKEQGRITARDIEHIVGFIKDPEKWTM
ncbi:orotate phosphoribosyltransferase [Candidatus Peregrinibacteria bacterium]|nr:orotate phosphoribosyltransferase [Candidatus Peregrinibacteria bacterium]